ncbi:MAG TPA: hypothetical protein VK871_02705 [Candidatus Limnocylindrales bacterium]|nr:hypothetical protein [Candidatus Limnocylindrales bacterium]
MGLIATLAIEPTEADAAERFVAVCRLTNRGGEAVDVNLSSLSSPSLALEIRDRGGAPFYLPPPPVPPVEPSIERLDPGRERAAEFAGFLPSWAEPGTYRARCRYVAGPGEPIVSEWVDFTLR